MYLPPYVDISEVGKTFQVKWKSKQELLKFNARLSRFVALHHRGAALIPDRALFSINKATCACLAVIVAGV